MYENMKIEQFMPVRCTQLREAMGVSARKMSLDLGQSSSYIGQYENGIFLPRMDRFIEICDYLKVTPSEYFEPYNTYPQLINQLNNLLLEINDDSVIEHFIGLATIIKEKDT